MTVAGYRFDVTCRNCGGPVKHVADGTSDASSVRVVVACTQRGCRRSWVITVAMSPTVIDYELPNEPSGLCGTPQGYRVHRRKREEPCEPCRAAHSADEHWRKHRRRELAGV